MKKKKKVCRLILKTCYFYQTQSQVSRLNDPIAIAKGC